MLVTESDDEPGRRRGLLQIVDEAVGGGVTMLQLRDKQALGMAARLMDTTRRRRKPWHMFRTGWRDPVALTFVNGDEGLAAECAAELHLPERRGSANTIRDEWYENMIISQSVHSLEAALRAERNGADMLVLGSVFLSMTHPGGTKIGLVVVRDVCAAVRVPVIGIGGITAQNAGDVIRAGASGVAVVSAIFDATDARAAAAGLRAAIDAAWAER
jgi:thiamine-phosphate pyrophosphorylase